MENNNNKTKKPNVPNQEQNNKNNNHDKQHHDHQSNSKGPENNQHNNNQKSEQTVDANKNNQVKEDVKPVENEVEKLHKENKELLHKVHELETQVENMHKKCESYDAKINTMNDDYSKKLTEKINQANTMIAAKIEELNTKHVGELTESKKYLITKIGAELAEIVDQFSLAINMKTDDPKLKNFLVGFQMYHQMLMQLLSNNGINLISIKEGEPFDEKKMEVIDVVVDPSKKEHTIAKVISYPYQMHDRLIKVGKVKIYKKHN